MAELVKGFKEFIFRGNIIELAIAFVIGGAFAAVVSSLVADLFMPLITMIVGEPNFTGLNFTINNSVFYYGNFLTAVVTFLAIAAAIYFIIVLPMNKIAERAKRGEVPADSPVKNCPECLSSIPKDARRCMYCTSQQTA